MYRGTCAEIISDIQARQTDQKNPNDCAKEPHEITHTVDSIRYFSISRTIAAELQKSTEEWEEEEITEDYDEYMTGGEANAAYINY